VNNSVGGYQQNAGAVDLGGSAQAASANFQIGAVGFGPHWSNAEDSMAASIIRLECQKDELNAEVALLREQARIMQRTIESLRDQLCADKCRDKAAADGGWANI
jgi:hypothetical protein